MKKIISILSLLLIHTIVQAADYEEVSYDSLLNELSGKKNKMINNSSRSSQFNDIQIHAGFAWIGTSTQVKYNDRSDSFFQNGIQMNLGIDLFSPRWISEATLRNFGTQDTHGKKISLREMDLKILYRNQLSNNLDYRLGGGLSTRDLKFRAGSYTAKENTPFSLLSVGIESHLNQYLSLGMETTIRTSMVTDSVDKNALDLSVRLEASF